MFLRRLLTSLFLRRLRLPRDAARWAFRRHADRLALLAADGRRVTFAELGSRVYALAAGLLGQGLAPGDRVAFLLPNCPEFVELRLACHEAGLVAVPLVWDLEPAARARALELAGARIYAYDPELDGGAAGLAAGLVPGLRCVPLPENDRSGLDALAAPGAGPCRARIAPSGPATINFTSGTTGEPKGVVSTGAAWMASVRMMAGSSRLAPGPDERFLHAIPMATAGWGPVLPCLLGGVAGLLLRRYRPADALDLAEHGRATRAFLTPSQLIDWLDEPILGTRDLSRLAAIICGTAPLPGAKAAEALRRFGPVLQQGYGLAEVLPPLALLWPEEHDPAGHPFRAGRPAAGVEVRIAGPDGSEAPAGARGEILVNSPTRTPGYWRRPELTAAALSGEFFRTGDIGFRDEAGYLSVIGRKAESVQGLALHPREVEEAAAAHESLKECALVAAPPGPTLAYSVRRGRELPEPEIERFLAARLPAGTPAILASRWSGDLPRSAAGKVVRGRLRA
ncbi:MAG TPA: AMP-binding protein [Planctomycetota bacterium]|nr:AMP-binding protein [Planctomycetota bacterium]